MNSNELKEIRNLETKKKKHKEKRKEEKKKALIEKKKKEGGERGGKVYRKYHNIPNIYFFSSIFISLNHFPNLNH